MNILSYFGFPGKKNTAEVAKERLQIILSHERSKRSPDYLPMLQKELIDVIAKYIPIAKDQVKVELDRAGNFVNLTLDITLTETPATVE